MTFRDNDRVTAVQPGGETRLEADIRLHNESVTQGINEKEQSFHGSGALVDMFYNAILILQHGTQE